MNPQRALEGICTQRQDGIFCFLGLSQCSYDPKTCKSAFQKCLCKFNPHILERQETVTKSYEAAFEQRQKTSKDGREIYKMPYPNGYCRWTGGLNTAFRCYHYQWQCTSGERSCEGKKEMNRCVCDYNPYVDRKERPSKERKKEPPQKVAKRNIASRKLLVDGKPITDLVYPDGYCRYGMGLQRPRQLYCYTIQRQCSFNKDQCRKEHTRCTCEVQRYSESELEQIRGER